MVLWRNTSVVNRFGCAQTSVPVDQVIKYPLDPENRDRSASPPLTPSPHPIAQFILKFEVRACKPRKHCA